MRKGVKRLACLFLMVGCCLPGCGKADQAEVSYTYRSYTGALGNNWNPHGWETSADSTMLGYLTMPFCERTVKDSRTGEYQWVFEMASSIEDVTAQHPEDLLRFSVTLPEGQTAEAISEGYVYEIRLNEKAKWENGEPITAKDYIYSMQQLLNPKMRNYRANLYHSGESAVAGGKAYYQSGSPLYTALEEGDNLEAGIKAGTVYLNVSAPLSKLEGKSLSQWNREGKLGLSQTLTDLQKQADAYGYTRITQKNRSAAVQVVTAVLEYLQIRESSRLKDGFFLFRGQYSPDLSYDSTVGCYQVDDYTIRYVTQNAIPRDYFLTACTSNWLVYAPYYEAGKDTSGRLVTTNYGTGLNTTMSCGPYRLQSLQTDKQVVFVQNENWYGWQEQDGQLVSYTDFLVDGQVRQQFQTTRIILDVMDPGAARQAFLKGALSQWTPGAEDLADYATSAQLYRMDETYTMSLFFNTNREKLIQMDRAKGNTNSVVLSNENFRKAMSLAIDREELVSITPGYRRAFTLMNDIYHYDAYRDPDSSYRNSQPAMEAVCQLYGVRYGPGTAYPTLEEAYLSINGYGLDQARECMALAFRELTQSGDYTAGEDIVIRVAWSAGGLDTAATNMVQLLSRYLNAAAEGTGFGRITLEPVGNLADRYSDVGSGEYAIGYGAWGGAAFYPFRNLQVYCDPDQYRLHEAGCWDPKTEMLTLTVEGQPVTQTWQQWSVSLVGSGRYAYADVETKLSITAQMEQQFLRQYYRIPLASSTASYLQSYQVQNYTDKYNIMYEFGGLRLMTYRYTDRQWQDYVSSQKGGLDYR